MQNTNPVDAHAIARPSGRILNESRMARKRRQTQLSLLLAARSILRDKGVDGTTIADITDFADVGFGTFYNYFNSKEELLERLVFDGAQDLGNRLWLVTLDVEDPARALVTAVRHIIRAVDLDPIWADCLVRCGLDSTHLMSEFNRRMVHRLEAGIEKGRFKASDVQFVFSVVSAMVVSGVRARLVGDTEPGFDSELAELVLRALGVESTEARDLSYEALIPLPDPGLDAQVN